MEKILASIGVIALGSYLIWVGKKNIESKTAADTGKRALANKLTGKNNVYTGKKAVQMGWIRIAIGIIMIIFGIIFAFVGPFLG